MLEHAAVRRAQDVREVLALVGAHLRDVRVQARLPAAVARAPAELDDQLAAVRRRRRPPPGAAPARTRRRHPAGSRASPRRRSTGARSGRPAGWSRASGRTMLGMPTSDVSSRRAAGACRASRLRLSCSGPHVVRDCPAKRILPQRRTARDDRRGAGPEPPLRRGRGRRRRARRRQRRRSRRRASPRSWVRRARASRR